VNAFTVAKKKRGLFRSTAGGLARAGGATLKGSAKVTGKAAKVAAKGTYATSKVTAKATYKTGKIAAKGGYITMRSGGKTLLFTARKAYPRLPDESKWQYRKRMAILGFKVSFFTGKIMMAASDSANVQQLVMGLAKDALIGAVEDKAQDFVIDRARGQILSTNNGPHVARTMTNADNSWQWNGNQWVPNNNQAQINTYNSQNVPAMIDLDSLN
jgi:hypothetical protein